MFKGTLILLLIIYVRNSSCIMGNIYDAGRGICQLYSKLDRIRRSSRFSVEAINALFSGDSAINKEIGDELDQLHQTLQQMETLINSKNLSNVFESWPAEIVISKSLSTIETLARSIDEYYDKFHDFRQESKYNYEKTLYQFMRIILLDVESQIMLMRKYVLEPNVFLPNSTGLLNAISSDAISLRNQLCDGPETISTMLYRLFQIVMVAEIKANCVLAFGNMWRFSRDPGWILLNSIAREAFEKRFAVYVDNFELVTELVDSLYLRACDPAGGVWIRDKNFYELEGTFQTTLFRYRWGLCKYGSCNDVWFVKPNRCEPTVYSVRSSCTDPMGDCTYLSAIQACVLETGPYKFQYVNSTELGSLGRNFQCPKDGSYPIEDGTGLDSVYAACACNCYGGDNKISLSKMESRTASNNVIIGLRFFRKNRIIYIQPREGKLTAHSRIARFSEKWIRLPRIIEGSQIHTINRTNRVFFLDTLRLPEHYALTGVKFNQETRGNVVGFAIEIFGVPFDFESGKLYSESRFRISRNASSDDPGEEISFEPVNSIYTPLRHTPNTPDAKYVSLKRSSLQGDFGQSTLPLFDAVPIEANPSVILGGIGIFHKGVEGYAGFISLKVFPISYKQFFTNFKQLYMTDGRVSFNYSIYNYI